MLGLLLPASEATKGGGNGETSAAARRGRRLGGEHVVQEKGLWRRRCLLRSQRRRRLHSVLCRESSHAGEAVHESMERASVRCRVDGAAVPYCAHQGLGLDAQQLGGTGFLRGLKVGRGGAKHG